MEPWLYTDITGSITIPEINGGKALEDVVSQVQLTIADSATDYQADDVRSGAMVPGRLNASLAFTMLLTGTTLELWKKYVYGKATPVDGDRPSASVLKGAGINFTFSRDGGADSSQFIIPKATYTVSGDVAGNPDGGAIEIVCTADSIPGPGTDGFQLISALPDEDAY